MLCQIYGTWGSSERAVKSRDMAQSQSHALLVFFGKGSTSDPLAHRTAANIHYGSFREDASTLRTYYNVTKGCHGYLLIRSRISALPPVALGIYSIKFSHLLKVTESVIQSRNSLQSGSQGYVKTSAFTRDCNRFSSGRYDPCCVISGLLRSNKPSSHSLIPDKSVSGCWSMALDRGTRQVLLESVTRRIRIYDKGNHLIGSCQRTIWRVYTRHNHQLFWGNAVLWIIRPIRKWKVHDSDGVLAAFRTSWHTLLHFLCYFCQRSANRLSSNYNRTGMSYTRTRTGTTWGKPLVTIAEAPLVDVARVHA